MTSTKANAWIKCNGNKNFRHTDRIDYNKKCCYLRRRAWITLFIILQIRIMMMSSNGSIFRVTGPLWREFAGRPGNPRTHKGQWRGALIFSLICAWINGWVNNRETDDLRRHRAHYDVILMFRRNDCVVPRTVIPKVPLQCCALDGQNEGDAMDSYTSKGMTLRWKSIEPTTYRKTSNIRRTLVGNKIVDHSDVVGASPVGAAPTTSSFST